MIIVIFDYELHQPDVSRGIDVMSRSSQDRKEAGKGWS